MRADEARAAELFDLLVAHPDGLDKWDICFEMDIDEQLFFRALRCLRLTLGEGDTLTVPVRREGRRAFYFLSGSVAEGDEWVGERIKRARAQVQVDRAYWASLTNASDGRTLEGRYIRTLARWTNRVAEDLAEIDDRHAASP